MGWGGGVVIFKNVLLFFFLVLIVFFVILYLMFIYFFIRLKVDCKFKMKKLYLENLILCNVIVLEVFGVFCIIFLVDDICVCLCNFLCKRFYFSSVF